MKIAWLPVVLAVAAAPLAARAPQAPAVRIIHPLPDTIISGPSRIGTTPDGIRDVLGASPHTRYPLYERDLDHIAGHVPRLDGVRQPVDVDHGHL